MERPDQVGNSLWPYHSDGLNCLIASVVIAAGKILNPEMNWLALIGRRGFEVPPQRLSSGQEAKSGNNKEELFHAGFCDQI